MYHHSYHCAYWRSFSSREITRWTRLWCEGRVGTLMTCRTPSTHSTCRHIGVVSLSTWDGCVRRGSSGTEVTRGARVTHSFTLPRIPSLRARSGRSIGGYTTEACRALGTSCLPKKRVGPFTTLERVTGRARTLVARWTLNANGTLWDIWIEAFTASVVYTKCMYACIIPTEQCANLIHLQCTTLRITYWPSILASHTTHLTVAVTIELK